ncbi:hypothetical protein DSO57_1022313 [Entomophthora muscae]|uniref:Uncharacterized protein n=1 Tax=Entomophthora muscae TaxID=34485 RepID=A0ACC2SG42_9FUNG|nr:hypothetical protein DSO57_1022313 [Entomophthora muscae]
MDKVTTPCMIILVGPPGCGKSTLATSWCKTFKGWVRINQDDLGTRKACEQACYVALKKSNNVIIDRCNFDSKQRKVWIVLGRQLNARIICLQFKLPVKTLENRVLSRTNHPTGVEGVNGLGILRSFLKSYTYPRLSEGFDKVITFPDNMVHGPTFGSIFWDWVQNTMALVLKFKDNLLDSPATGVTPFETELFGVPSRPHITLTHSSETKNETPYKTVSKARSYASTCSPSLNPNAPAWGPK